MDPLEIAFAYVRIVLYFFTVVSLIIAGGSVWKPMSAHQRHGHPKAFMLWSLASVFLLWAIAAVFRVTQWSTEFALWIIDYPVTIAMIGVSYFCWVYVFRSSKPDFEIDEKPPKNSC